MARQTKSFTLIALSSLLGSASFAAEVPTHVGECVDTQIKQIGTRLENTPGSGSSVEFTNGEYQVSYDTIPAIERSEPGDPVRLCLVSIPTNCPKGDRRGRIYLTTNLRTHASWRLANSQHMCGGA